MKRRLIEVVRVTALPLLCLLCGGCNHSQDVVIRKVNESVERHFYDKDNRPEEEVERHPSVEANTHWEFEFVPEIRVQRVNLQQKAGEYISTFRVKKVEIALSLPIRVWLPESASQKVIDHEDGHVAICKHFYKDAEKQARSAAEKIIGCEFSGVGKSENESMQKGMEAASFALVKPYQDSVIQPANRASALYDALTMHGQASVAPEAAVKEAIGSGK